MSNQNIQQLAAIVLQEIDADLALAKKATPGPWTTSETSQQDLLLIRGADLNAKWRSSTQLPANDATFIAASRTGWPSALRCLKTAIEGLMEMRKWNDTPFIREQLTTLCDKWEASR